MIDDNGHDWHDARCRHCKAASPNGEPCPHVGTCRQTGRPVNACGCDWCDALTWCASCDLPIGNPFCRDCSWLDPNGRWPIPTW